jgi:hypothetical protein
LLLIDIIARERACETIVPHPLMSYVKPGAATPALPTIWRVVDARFCGPNRSVSRSIFAKMLASCDGNRLLEHQQRPAIQPGAIFGLAKCCADRNQYSLKISFVGFKKPMFYIELNNGFLLRF